ncbi:MAG: TetR/AcrR family transcriptional regulator, partial [Mycobacteriaceae bacterium]
EHLALKRETEIRSELGGTQDRARAVELLSEAFAGPLFLAALELWVAARTEPSLRRSLLPLERRVAEALTALGAELLDVPAGSEVLELTIELVRGLGMAVLFNSPATAQRRRQRLLVGWQRILEQQ